jgi:hypothetical protein
MGDVPSSDWVNDLSPMPTNLQEHYAQHSGTFFFISPNHIAHHLPTICAPSAHHLRAICPPSAHHLPTHLPTICAPSAHHLRASAHFKREEPCLPTYKKI